MPESFDCIVVGGGPAGSTAAALVAEAGFSTLLLEREKMPRFHVGESLMPETYWTFQRLGVLDKLKASACPKKYSVQFVNDRGKTSQPFYFHQHDPRECSQTWQVLRSEFDKMLFDNAAEKGADCRDGVRVLDVLFEPAASTSHLPDGTSDSDGGQKAVGIKIQSSGGEPQEIGARVVIDATGQQSLIATRLGIRRENPDLRKSAIWTYFRGVRRDPGVDEGATIIMHTDARESWFWYIPLANDVTSLGVVGDTDYLLRGRGKPADIFNEELAKCPSLLDRMRNAVRTDDEVHVAREFSYKSERPAGEGWVLVGDALGFVDPIYSSGVFFALKSGELAADCVIAGLRAGDTSAEQLGGWAADFDKGVELVRKLVAAFYTREFSFGRFIKSHPEHTGNLVDLLIGRIFYPAAGDIFKAMDPMLAATKAPCPGGPNS
jgi:flavin-dependent dehydrogenase